MESNPSAYPMLQFLNEFSDIHKTQNHLPHWHQDRATYFVTFRLGDSIPANLLKEWRQERERWGLDHPKPWSLEIEKEYHKHFSARFDRHLDEGHGSCLFREKTIAEIVAGAIRYFDQHRYLLHGWVIMPNHVHLLLTLGVSESLASIVSSWKRFTAVNIHARTHLSGSMWQKDYFDRIIRDWDHFVNVARYIRHNPVKAKLRNGEYLLEEAAWVNRLLA